MWRALAKYQRKQIYLLDKPMLIKAILDMHDYRYLIVSLPTTVIFTSMMQETLSNAAITRINYIPQSRFAHMPKAYYGGF
jgi:hypothetical protein